MVPLIKNKEFYVINFQATKKTEDDFFKDSCMLESSTTLDDNGDTLMSSQSDNIISQSLNFEGLGEDISSPELR